ASAVEPRALGAVGSRHAGPVAGAAPLPFAVAIGRDAPPALGEGDLGLAGKKPNIEISQSFVIAQPQREVWNFFAQVERVVPCMPGATLSGSCGAPLQGQLALQLGPIPAAFTTEGGELRHQAMARCEDPAAVRRP